MTEICALCESVEAVNGFDIPASPSPSAVLICSHCQGQIIGGALDSDHFHCLNTAMWSEDPAVKVLAYRLLKQLSEEAWAQDALDLIYLDDETREWAEAGVVEKRSGEPTRDSNGTALNDGDNVTIIKDLPVKGAGFTAKRGTAVRGITLTDNPEHIEGRVNGQRIVLVSAFLKKA